MVGVLMAAMLPLSCGEGEPPPTPQAMAAKGDGAFCRWVEDHAPSWYAGLVDLGICVPYDPCEAPKRCGDACTLCDPDDPDCVETQELKACNKDGQCVAEVVSCDEDPDPGCATASCGAPCDPCEGAGPSCTAPSVPHVCDQDGKCTYQMPSCPEEANACESAGGQCVPVNPGGCGEDGLSPTGHACGPPEGGWTLGLMCCPQRECSGTCIPQQFDDEGELRCPSSGDAPLAEDCGPPESYFIAHMCCPD